MKISIISFIMLFAINLISYSQVEYIKGKEDKIQAWQDHYTSPPDVASCNEGILKDSEKLQILNYVNFIRSIHNLLPVQYDLGGDEAAQKSALIQAANSMLSHTPPSSSSCYSQIGYYGSEMSNLFLYQMSQPSDIESKQSITGWMLDNNSANAVDRCGHRRAIINPFVTAISFGRVDGKSNVGSQWCIGMALKYMDNVGGSIQSRPVEYVAYPYQSYPPELVDKSWYLSFSPFYNMNSWSGNSNIDYNNAQITVTTESGQPMNVHSIIWDFEGWGAVQNNIRWKVDNMQNEVKYIVNIKNIVVNGSNKDYQYWFKLTNNVFNQKPATPLLSSPANNAVNMSLNLGFSWSVSEFTYQYHFQLARDYNFNNIVSDQKVTSNGIVVKDLSPTTTFYWRVKAINDNGESSWSDIFTFTTAAPKPDKPSLLSPPNGQQNVSVIPTLSWNNIPGAEKYQLQIAYKSDFSGFSVIIDKNDIQDTLYKVEADKLSFNTTYYWRVASIAAGQKSSFSTVWSFKTKDKDPVPDQVILSQPPNNKTEVEYNPLLKWDEITSATNYRVQVATSFNFKENDLVVNKIVLSNSYQVMSGELKSLTNYFWRVQGINESGYGDWSQIWNFTTANFSSVKESSYIKEKFSITPHPVFEFATLSTDTEFDYDYKFELLNLIGTRINDFNRFSIGINSVNINMNGLPKGVYFLKIVYNGKYSIIKFEKI